MKHVFLFLISLYQLCFPFRGNCRFYPTCSQYGKIVIREHGVLKGGWLTLLRLLSCQPLQVQSSKCKVILRDPNF